MKIKYGTDEYGNMWQTQAQIEPKHKTVCYNPRTETIEEPPKVMEGKRLIVEDGKWTQVDISSDCIKDGDIIRPKNQIERYKDGIDEIPKGIKLVTVGLDTTLEQKTLEEQLKTKEITQAQYNEIKNQPIIQALSEIDIKKVRSISDWILKQSDCPEFLKQFEKEAITKRSELLK